MAPLEPWEIGEPMVTSGSIHYNSNVYRSYPDYYYPTPLYYPAPSVSYVRPGRRHHGSRPDHYRPGAHRPGAHRPGHTASRPHRNEGHDRHDRHDRPASRPSAGNGNWTRPRGESRPAADRPGRSGRLQASNPATHRLLRNNSGEATRRTGLGSGAAGLRQGNNRTGGLGGRDSLR